MSATTGLDDDLLAALGGGYDINSAVTSDGLQSFKDTLSATGLGSIAMDGSNPDLVGSVRTMTPEEREELGLLDWDADKLNTRFEAAGQMKEGGTGLNLLYGDMEDVGPFVSDSQWETINDNPDGVAAVDALSETGKAVIHQNEHTKNAIADKTIPASVVTDENMSALGEEDVIELFETGELTEEDSDLLANWDDTELDWKSDSRTEERVDTAYAAYQDDPTDENLDNMLDQVFGTDKDWLPSLRKQADEMQWAADHGLIPQSDVDAFKQILDPEKLNTLTDVDLKSYLEGSRRGEFPWEKYQGEGFQETRARIQSIQTFVSKSPSAADISYDLTMQSEFYGEGSTFTDDQLKKMGLPTRSEYISSLVTDGISRADNERSYLKKDFSDKMYKLKIEPHWDQSHISGMIREKEADIEAWYQDSLAGMGRLAEMANSSDPKLRGMYDSAVAKLKDKRDKYLHHMRHSYKGAKTVVKHKALLKKHKDNRKKLANMYMHGFNDRYRRWRDWKPSPFNPFEKRPPEPKHWNKMSYNERTDAMKGYAKYLGIAEYNPVGVYIGKKIPSQYRTYKDHTY
jgi:hypothetical protein